MMWADRRRHNLIRVYIGQPLLLLPMVLLYTRITVEQWMDPGGSNDERADRRRHTQLLHTPLPARVSACIHVCPVHARWRVIEFAGGPLVI